MPAEMIAEIAAGDVARIVESVFGAMLGLELTHSEVPWRPSANRLISSVCLTGQWNGAFRFECDPIQACRLAGLYLSIDTVPAEPPAEVGEVVRDVIGELANMIGGNVKSILGPGIFLSMPTVVDGGDSCQPLGAAEVRERQAFEWAGGVFWVTVLHNPSCAPTG